MPPSRKRSATPMEIVAAWAQIYHTIFSELIDRKLPEEEAAKTAAYVAATLVKEIEVGNDTRKH